MTITSDQLKKIVPEISAKNLTIYTPLLNAAFAKHKIDTLEDVRCFIAQVAHESGSFNYTAEIASGKAYEGRTDLGNTNPGDGIKFKGRGLIQTTGRDNYELCSMYLFQDERLLDTPEILEQPDYALESACFYWDRNNLSAICNKPDGTMFAWRSAGELKYNKFQYLTIRINGALNGYKDRLDFYNRAKEVIV